MKASPDAYSAAGHRPSYECDRRVTNSRVVFVVSNAEAIKRVHLKLWLGTASGPKNACLLTVSEPPRMIGASLRQAKLVSGPSRDGTSVVLTAVAQVLAASF